MIIDFILVLCVCWTGFTLITYVMGNRKFNLWLILLPGVLALGYWYASYTGWITFGI